MKDLFTATYILLYSIVCHGFQKSFPVGQMLSQVHNMQWLIHWLNTWMLGKQNICPHEITLDESSALIGACVAVFTQDKTTFQYIDRCVNVILKKSVELPKCYIRIDRSHFVKSIHRNLRTGPAKTTRLLRGVMGYLISCSNRREFEEIMKNVFTLIRNEFISPNVIQARDMLLLLVRTHKIFIEAMFPVTEDVEIDNAEVNQEDMIGELASHKDTCSYRWVMNFYNSVEIAGDDMPENIYHSTRFEKYLIHSFVRSPLWSNLMMHEFESDYDYATSTPVENEFKTIKHLLDFKKKSVPAFVKKHLEYLTGEMNIRNADHIQKEVMKHTSTRLRSNSADCQFKKPQIRRSSSLKEQSIESHDSNSDDDSFQILEDWRNKVKTSSQPQKSNRSRRSVNSILSKHDPEYFRSDIKLLTNGYESPKIVTEHTCAFDSIYPIMCVAYWTMI